MDYMVLARIYYKVTDFLMAFVAYASVGKLGSREASKEWGLTPLHYGRFSCLWVSLFQRTDITPQIAAYWHVKHTGTASDSI